MVLASCPDGCARHVLRRKEAMGSFRLAHRYGVSVDRVRTSDENVRLYSWISFLHIRLCEKCTLVEKRQPIVSAAVAQWIEQEPSNLLVAGSIPARGANQEAFYFYIMKSLKAIVSKSIPEDRPTRRTRQKNSRVLTLMYIYPQPLPGS